MYNIKDIIKPCKDTLSIINKNITLESPKQHVCQTCKYCKEIGLGVYKCSNKNLHEMDKIWVKDNNVKLCGCDL